MEGKKIIYILVIPAWGHVNTLTGLVYELTHNKNTRVVFYGFEEHRTIIEKTGAEFRHYKILCPNEFKSPPIHIRKRTGVSFLINKLIDFSDFMIPSLIKEIETDQPDLIIYDHISLHTKYLLKILHSNYEKKLSNFQPPKAIIFTQSFGMQKNLYPNKEESKLYLKQNAIGIFSKIYCYCKQIYFSWRHGIDIMDPFKFLFNNKEDLTIVSVFPELQPRSSLFDGSFKFVGSCVSYKVRKNEITDSRVKNVLELFKPVNPLDPVESIPFEWTKRKLIYVSFGTVFNTNLFIYETIIKSFQIFQKETLCEFNVIMAVGKECYGQFELKIKNENYKLPENILLLSTAPQLDILQRACLFVTHAGMNSINEAIYYSVPVVCIPIYADQPLVALRVCEELRLGLNFNFEFMTAEKLAKGIREVLEDKTYLQRMIKFSKLSRTYDGNSTAAKIITEFINQKYSNF